MHRKCFLFLNNVFADINDHCDSEIAVNNADNFEFDDDLLDEWHEFLQDDELYDMILDNLSLSQLESSVLEENASDSDNDDVMPPAVLATVENMALDH